MTMGTVTEQRMGQSLAAVEIAPLESALKPSRWPLPSPYLKA